MYNFTRYNILNETYESYKELKNLTKDILKFDAKKNKVYYIKDIFENTNYESDYPILKDFIKVMGLVFSDITQKALKAPGAFAPPSDYGDPVFSKILFPLNLNYLKENFKKGLIIYSGNRFSDIFSVILHELQHGFDNYRSNKKMLVSKSAKKFETKYKKMLDDGGKGAMNLDLLNAYHRSKNEQSAFFINAINKTKFVIDDEVVDIHSAYHKFKNHYTGYEFLTPKIRKKLARKFSQYYHKYKDEIS